MTRVGFGKRAAWAALVVWTASATGTDVGRTVAPPAIDGRLDDACWAAAEWHSDFTYMKSFGRTGTPDKRTEFAMTADDACLYVAVRCFEPELGRVKSATRDNFWSRESVELFFSPDGTTFEFYHFGLSPSAIKPYAAFLSEGGNIQPDPYAPAWRQAYGYEEKAWTAEIAIPFSAFYMTRNRTWRQTWLVNVARTTHFGGVVDYTWSPLETKFHEPGSFRKLGGFPLRPAAEDVAVRGVLAEIERADADGLKGRLQFSVHAGVPGRHTVESSCGGRTSVELRQGENKLTLPCVYKANGRASTHFTVTAEGGRPCERDFPVIVDFKPIRVKLTQPQYRNNFYPGQPTDRVAGRVKLSGGGEATVTLEGPGFPRRAATLKDGGEFSFDTKGFATGDAWLTVACGGETEKVRIRNLPPSPRRMTWIENGHVMMNGRRMLRRNMWAYDFSNGVACQERLNAEKASFRYTDELENCCIEPMRLIKGIEQKEGVYDVRPSKELIAKIDERMDSCKDKDFGMWFLIDEPECRNISPVWLRHLYDYVAERDPYHVITTDSRGGKAYVDCFDYVQTHPYLSPVNMPNGERRYGVPPCEIGSYVDAFELSDRPDKAIGIVPMAFAYRWTSIRNDYPTFDEYVCSVWAGVIRGACGLHVYAGHDINDRPRIWEGVRYVFETFAALEQLVLDGRRTTLFRSKESEGALYELGDEKLVVAVNFTQKPVTVRLDGAKGEFLEFRAERTFRFGSEPVTLQPLETLVATTKRHDLDLAPRAEIVRRIAEKEAERVGRDNQLLERYDDVTAASNMGSFFGGGVYKLIDGVRDMMARESKGKPDAWLELSFRSFRPSFDKVRVFGFGVRRMTVEIPHDGGWRTLEPVSRKNGKYSCELDFGKAFTAERIRLSFPAKVGEENAIEIYEVELPRVGDGVAAGGNGDGK